jgi:hypothetical protein
MPASSTGPGQLGDFPMKNYSIVRLGSEYVVQAGDTSVLKVASRRQAARLVIDAAELLGREPVPAAEGDPSIDRDKLPEDT